MPRGCAGRTRPAAAKSIEQVGGELVEEGPLRFKLPAARPAAPGCGCGSWCCCGCGCCCGGCCCLACLSRVSCLAGSGRPAGSATPEGGGMPSFAASRPAMGPLAPSSSWPSPPGVRWRMGQRPLRCSRSPRRRWPCAILRHSSGGPGPPPRRRACPLRPCALAGWTAAGPAPCRPPHHPRWWGHPPQGTHLTTMGPQPCRRRHRLRALGRSASLAAARRMQWPRRPGGLTRAAGSA